MNILSKRKLNISDIRFPHINLTKKTQQNSLLKREEIELKNAVNNALIEWKCTAVNFDYADAPEMVEFYTYKMKACEIRYQYLLKRFKNVVDG